MPLYRYKAVASSGDTVEGEMEAEGQKAAVKRLQALGHLPVRVDEVKGHGVARFLQRDLFRREKASAGEIAVLTGDIATLLHAGVALDRTLEIIAELAEQETVKRLVDRILDSIRGGSSLADALGAEDKTFPAYYVSMVRAGEAGGSLEVVLDRLSGFMAGAIEVRERVRSALIYPMILLGMAILAIVVLMGVVVPRFKPLFEDAGEALPVATQIVVAIGEGIEAYWWLIALAIIAGVGIFRHQLRSPAWRYRWDLGKLRTPLLGPLLIKAEVARFCRTLGTLIGNGVGMLSALSLAGDTIANAALARDIETVAGSLKEGKSLTEPLADSDLFPRLAIHLTRVGEETGKMEEMLLKVADIYDQDVQRTLDRALALLVPVFTIVLGVIIAGIIGSILAAILSVYELPI
ncbi:MAG: type II secretion system F family protein [Alphaproteobacteria bacterium]|jgi:general secretion pathway protein F